MRRLFVGMVVAAAAALVPTWALAGNQEVAEQIAASLRESGQLQGYKIGVKYQDGTAWLRGQVTSREQMQAALDVVQKAPGVTRVVNNLAVASDAAAPAAQASVQPVDSALAAERLPRIAAWDLRAPQSQRPVVEESAAPQEPVRRAERLQANFAPATEPQVAMTSLQEPTPAPARPSETIMAPAVVSTPMLQPAQQPAIPAAAPQVIQQPVVYATPYAGQQSQPLPIAYTQPVPVPAPTAPAPLNGMVPAPAPAGAPGAYPMAPIPAGAAAGQYEQPNMPGYAWPCYAAHPNYAAVTYPKQYSPTAWPYIGPFYPYPQVPLGWRRVTLEWHDGWWNLNFDDGHPRGVFSGIFRPFHD